MAVIASFADSPSRKIPKCVMLRYRGEVFECVFEVAYHQHDAWHDRSYSHSGLR